MFGVVFYIFSLLLSYTDYKSFIVPNVILGTMGFMLLFFGLIEDKIYMSSFAVPLLILLFFIAILLLKPNMILGGGDIKYMMVVGLFLPYTLFPLFLIVTGILQSLTLLYMQNIKKRRVAAMVPVMFVSVVITQFIAAMGIYPLT
ncbi:MAG: A24 family peptidase [Campylobacterota bacterium]|nr:A24 family peptidase [Campylobacterota bacterium]